MQFQLYYDTFLEFGKKIWTNSPPSPTVHEFISQTLCERNHDEVFYNKKCVNRKHCHGCGNIVLFHNKYPIDNDQSLSNVTIDWRRYEYKIYSTSSSDAHSKRIELREDKICVIDILKKIESEIYKYTNHSHKALWKDLQFKHSREIFSAGTILFVVGFAENYTFAAKKEIQSEYYHFDQVSIFVHFLYRHSQQDVDGI